MAKIYSPNESYTGVSASVAFSKGIGETEDGHLIEWFKEHGYRIEEIQKKVEGEAPTGEEAPKDKNDKKAEGSK